MQFVHQQEIADQQRIFHGAGRNLKRLNDKRDHVNAKDHDSKESLYPEKVLRLSMALALRSGWRSAFWQSEIRLNSLRLSRHLRGCSFNLRWHRRQSFFRILISIVHSSQPGRANAPAL